MAEFDLLKSLPRGKRNVKARETAKTEEHIRISREYGEMYFDGPREYGYGGYRYDGRWQPVARDIVHHFGLKPGDRVLDVGCAKGFLLKDLLALGIDAYRLLQIFYQHDTIDSLPLDGVTGKVSLNGHLLEREAMPAVLRQGLGIPHDGRPPAPPPPAVLEAKPKK